MAKKTPVKKPRRRLKRSIRRSLAAVLMITAIGVAAVPVPENFAEDGRTSSNAGMSREASDDHKMDDFKYEPDAKKDESLRETTKFQLGKYDPEDTDEDSDKNVFNALEDGDVDASYAVIDLGAGQWQLGWQFLFYSQTNPRSNTAGGVICKYNNEFSFDKVELSLFPITSYFVVETADYDKYWTNYAAVTASNYLWDPTQKIEYTYDEWKVGAPADDILHFFTKYFDAAYKERIKEFEAYKKLEDANKKDPDKNPLPSSKPAAFSKVPVTDLSAEQKQVFYCESYKPLVKMGSGYTLVSVNDARPKTSSGAGSGEGGSVYLARGGTPVAGYENDSAGFLIQSKSDFTMCAIGNKAFKGINNVENMTIPAQIGYIGNEAFASASLLKSISLNNVDVIGNRAFKNCVSLQTASLGQSTQIVGQECFSGTDLESVTFSNALQTIGYGAFSNCRNLKTVTFAKGGQECTIKGYAFYNDPSLSTVAMTETNIIKIEDAAFAVESGSQPMGFVLPKTMGNDPDCLGNYLFAGRSSLESVVMPQGYGRSASTAASIPDEMFHGCANLKYVEFPCDPKNDPSACGFVSYTPQTTKINAGLFIDIINPDFYVKGPKMNTGGNPALPRTSTWDAVTAVSDTIPYLYVENGVEYYEVSDGFYLLCINNKGILTSCTLKPRASIAGWDGRLEIPAKVGNTKVVGIASGCFSDPELNAAVKYLKIADDSISSIGDGVFQASTDEKDKQWKKLTTVYIGNSVTSIGKDAFKNCSALTDVTFNSPLAGHAKFVIGTDAFKTGSEELTFHGDIVKGYAPFEWATDPNNIIDSEKENSKGIRVCYKSLNYLTVMYNPITKMTTLLDYPKHDQISGLLAQAHAQDLKDFGVSTYEEYREAYLYALYGNADYDSYRVDFKNAWSAALNEEDVEAAKEAVYQSDVYGPWANPQFCANWNSWQPSVSGNSLASASDIMPGYNASDSASVVNKMTDWLFEPIVAYAAEGDPKPYYETYPYDIFKNAEVSDPYRPSTPEEDNLRYTVENIVVPAGVDSIDVYGYINNLTTDGKRHNGPESNTHNYGTYFNLTWDTDTRNMYTKKVEDVDDPTDVVPGLFSGYYVDYTSDSDNEKFKRGNDSIKTVTLGSVKYLPDYAFDSCEQLWSVSLGEACSDIGKAPFRGCYAMNSMVGNQYYEADNGIIYSKNADGSLTIEECFASRGKEGIVGQASVSIANDPKLNNVSAIKPGAFEDCDVVTDINLGNNSAAGLAVIPEDCFKNCDNLQRVVLPVTVNDVGSGAFVGSNKLSELTVYGKEVKISGTAFDNDPAKAVTRVRTYADSAVVRYVKEYGVDYKLQIDENPLGEQWQVTFLDADYNVIKNLKDRKGNPLDNPQYVDDGRLAVIPQDPVKEGWTFNQWVGMNSKSLDDSIEEDTVFYAQGFSNNGMVDGKFVVEFYDSVDGAKLGPTQYIEPGKDAIPPAQPVHTGYTFDKWSDSTTNIQSNKSILALYKASSVGNTSGGSSNTPGGSNGSTNVPGANTSNNTSSNKSSSSSTSTTSSTTSSSTASTSTTSSDAAARSLYVVTVIGGSGSGSYASGTTVQITANTPAAGSVFSKWVTDSQGVSLASATATPTTFTMPSNNVTITAEYTAGTTPATTPASTGGNSGGGSSSGGNTNDGGSRVDITKPGISNKDLASANVNGSTDNFIVKITETDEATRAVADALTNKYGSLENILYYAMDISLYDSTGTVKIADTSGISVDITIPIPDALVAYGGNNMAGAVVNGNQLEGLNESFTTINGVPCIRFTATHFSPYTVYVDTGNLTEGMLDTTPKTGDPIHPKWFLSIGLACLSIILFMKKDKSAKVKTA